MRPPLRVIRTELSAAVSSGTSGRSAADKLCAACVDLLGVDGAAVSIVLEGATRGTFGSSSETGRRLDEHQFTFGEGPCLDAAVQQLPVLVPDLGSPEEKRWPGFAGAVLDDGIHGVFAWPIMLTSVSVGALDLFRADPGPLQRDQLVGAQVAAELASVPLLDLVGLLTVDDDVARSEAGLSEPAPDDRVRWDRAPEIDRNEVFQATGMLMVQLGVDAAEALVRLRAHAIATGRTASAVAVDIVERRLHLDRDAPDRRGGGRS